MIIFVSVSMFDHKPEHCPFGHQLWPGMAQVGWNPASARRRGRWMGAPSSRCPGRRSRHTPARGTIVGMSARPGRKPSSERSVLKLPLSEAMAQLRNQIYAGSEILDTKIAGLETLEAQYRRASSTYGSLSDEERRHIDKQYYRILEGKHSAVALSCWL
jgi:hypothetical protein